MKTPWHLWVVGIAALLWNAGGAYDYWMTRTGNEAYLSNLTEDTQAMIAGAPLWFDIAWALGVWGAVAGSVLLLLRSRWAAPAYAVSILGLLVSAVWSYGIADPSSLQLMGSFALVFSALILVVLLLLWAYARRMRQAGVLG